MTERGRTNAASGRGPHTASSSGDEVVVTIADSGIGMSADTLARIFERFFIADEARTAGGGNGLGLAIARRIVQLHGGTIAVTSEPGEGAEFCVRLPLHLESRG